MSENGADLEATTVREILDRIPGDMDHTANVPETIEAFAREVVETGTFWPDCRVKAELSLTPRERLTGKRSQDVTAMICAGLVLGAALERDVPTGGEREEAWRAGEFRLPDTAPAEANAEAGA